VRTLRRGRSAEVGVRGKRPEGLTGIVGVDGGRGVGGVGLVEWAGEDGWREGV